MRVKRPSESHQYALIAAVRADIKTGRWAQAALSIGIWTSGDGLIIGTTVASSYFGWPTLRRMYPQCEPPKHKPVVMERRRRMHLQKRFA